MRTLAISATLALVFLAGCSSLSTQYTNDSIDPPGIPVRVTDNLADVEIQAEVRGKACAQDFLRYFKYGTSRYYTHLGDASGNALERAKSAAAAMALKSNGQGTAFLVNPVWEITDSSGFFVREACATVKAHLGVIKGFKKLDSNTHQIWPINSK
jgi:hypothetical protein